MIKAETIVKWVGIIAIGLSSWIAVVTKVTRTENSVDLLSKQIERLEDKVDRLMEK